MSEKREALTGFPFFMALYQLYLKVSFSEILKLSRRLAGIKLKRLKERSACPAINKTIGT